MANFNRLITLNSVVGDVMGQLGLIPPITLVDSQDRTAIQMWALANQAGEKLLNEGTWQVLSKEMTIVTDGVTVAYPLPEDFDHFVQDAAWNRTTRLPAVGSLTEGEWQQLKARNLGGTTFAMLFQVVNDTVEFYSVGTTPQTIVLPYMGRGWARSAQGALKDKLDANDDVILYDPSLFKAALKFEFMVAKGFDAQAAFQAYTRCLQAAQAKEAPARTLTLTTRGYPFLSEVNLPHFGV